MWVATANPVRPPERVEGPLEADAIEVKLSGGRSK
jgi:hypothetical protein